MHPTLSGEQRSTDLDDRLAALAAGKLGEEDQKRTIEQLRDESRHQWDAREGYRRSRLDSRNLYRGRHWDETVKNLETGSMQTEKDYLESKGRIPIVMNLVGNVVNNIDGQFRQNRSGRLAYAVESEDQETIGMMNLARRAARRYNQSETIEADEFREHILSGAAGFKSTIGWDERLQRHEVMDRAIDQTKFFYNLDIQDRRFTGLRLIGELHDISLSEAIRQFATDRKDEDRIREIFDRGKQDRSYDSLLHDFTAFERVGFLQPDDPSQCRVVETWRPVYQWVRYGIDPLFELVDGYGLVAIGENEIAKIQNERRRAFEAGEYAHLGLSRAPLLELDESRYDPLWHYFFYSSDGDLLKMGKTPYLHGEHPYSPGLAMLIDGETWGVMDNIKDPQRWLNRVLIHVDHQLSAGGQGMLGVDKQILEDSGLSIDDVADQYGRPNGVVSFDKGNRNWDSVLHQFNGKGLQPGWGEMIPTISNFIQQISGVSGASQGFEPKSGTPAALYQQQVLQANLNVLGFLQTYFETLRRKDKKDLQLIPQAFEDGRKFASERGQGSVSFDASRVKNIDWDVAIGDVADTAVYRQLWESDLQEMLMNGFFGPPGPQALQTFLEASSHPRAEALKHIISSTAMGAPAPGMDPGAAALSDPASVAAILAQTTQAA